MSKYVVQFLGVLSAWGCATTASTDPRAMSAAQHRAAAVQEENAAALHSRNPSDFGPSQSEPRAVRVVHCKGNTPSRDDVCWSSRTNPRPDHLMAVQIHEELAAKHRAAAATLEAAEARACAGINAEDRAVSPLFRWEDISSVKPIEAEKPAAAYTAGANAKPIYGATIVFRGVPGLTAQWLQRLADCHIARAAAVGNDMPELSYCPLTLRDVKAQVSAVADGFELRITSEDSDIGKEIRRRAQVITQSLPAR